jgi:hypothetical protein
MDQVEKRLDIACNAIEQQITLATALLGVALAFSDQLSAARQGRVWELLPWAFVPLAVSISSGVLALMSISYHLRDDSDPIAQRDVRIAGIVQNATFLLSIILVVGVIAIA